MIQHFQRFGRQILVYGLGDTINKVVAVLIVPLFTRYLTPTDYGVAAILVVTNSLIIGICDLGMSSSIPRFYKEENEAKRSRIISTAQITVIVTTLLVAILGSLFAPQISDIFFKTPNYHYLVILTFFTVPMTMSVSAPMMSLRLNEYAKLYSFFNVARTLTGIGLNILLIVGLKRGINGMFEANLINAALYALIIGGYSIRLNGVFFSREHLKKMLIFGYPFIMGLMTFWIMDWADRFLLGRLINLSEVGLYNLGYSIGMAIMLPVGAFETAWPPFFMSIFGQKNEKEIYSSVLTYYVLIIGFIILIITVLAPDYFRLFTPNEYHSAYIIVPLIAFSYSLRGVFSITAVGSFLKKRISMQLIAELIAMILNVITMFILIPKIGRMGAAWATAIAYVSMPVTIFFLSRKFFKIEYEYGRLVQILLIGFGVYFLTKSIYQPNNLNLFLRLGILILYPLFLYLFGFFKVEELKHLSSIRRKVVSIFSLKRGS